MLLEVERLTGQALPSSVLIEAPTIRRLAWKFTERASPESPAIVSVQAGMTGRRSSSFMAIM